MNDLKLGIQEVGQPYVDEPVVVSPKATPITWAVAEAFGRVLRWREPNGIPRRELLGTPPITVGHERIKLNWKSP